MMESILLFSLAALIIVVGLLVYYFKKRIAEVEQKSSKSLEIVHDLYMQQMKMKNDFNAIIQSLQDDVDDNNNNIQYEQIEPVNTADEIKTVNVDLSFPEETMIEITNDDDSVDEVDENDEQPELVEEEDHIVVNKLDNTEHQESKSVSKEELKKMTPSTLKSLVLSKGVSPDVVHKMKKNELIDVLMKL